MNKPHKPETKKAQEKPTTSPVVKWFVERVIAVARELSFKHKYVDFQKFLDNVIDLSYIVFDENDRLIFSAGEEAIMNGIFVAGKRSMEPRAVYLTGTPYGLVVLHGQRESYHAENGLVYGEVPSIHTTKALRSATVRHMQRTGKLKPNETHWPMAQDDEVLAWITSPNFAEEVAAQVKDDELNGVDVGDGMKIFERKVHPRVERQQQRSATPQHRRNLKSNKAQQPTA